MTSLLNANLPSDDEEDTDYDPTKDKTGSDEERKARGTAGVLYRGRIPVTQQHSHGAPLGDKRGREADSTAETSGQVADTAKKAKVNDIWAKLKQKTGVGPSAAAKAGQPKDELGSSVADRKTAKDEVKHWSRFVAGRSRIWYLNGSLCT
jgi:hypothetical protein